MDINSEQLCKKILVFWERHPKIEWNVELIRSEFSKDELITIFNIGYNSDYDNKNVFVMQKFYSLIADKQNIFTVDEIYELNPDVKSDDPVCLHFHTLTDDNLIELLKRYNNKEIQYNIFSCLRTDESRELAFGYMKKSDYMDNVVSMFDSEDLIIKHLKSVPYGLRAYVVFNLESDYFKEKFLNIFRGDKATIIRSLSTDEKKLYYFKRYYLFLDTYSKIDIISSFDNVDNILKYAHLFKKEDELQYFIGKIMDSNKTEVAMELCFRIKNDDLLTRIIARHVDEFPLDKLTQLLDKINDGFYLSKILDLFPLELRLKYIESVGQENRKYVIRGIGDPVTRITSLKYLEKFSYIEEVIEHTEEFPQYSDEFEFLIDKYATCYNLNKSNLLYMVKNIDMSVLKLVKNDNLKRIINSDEQSFYKVMELFVKDNYKLDSGALNDVLNSLLQREFKLVNTDIVLVFPYILQAIEFGNTDKAIELINKIIDEFKTEFDVEKYLSGLGYDKNSFINKLFEKDSKTIEVLHEITARYIRFKRNEYIKDNIGIAKDNSMNSELEKKSYMKAIFSAFPEELIVSMFPEFDERREREWYAQRGFTEEDLTLLENRDLLLSIIKYKKNPTQYDVIPLEVKQNLGMFNKLFERVINSNYLLRKLDVGANKTYSFKEVKGEHIVSILASLDIDKLKMGILNNPEMFEKLFKLLKQYKMLGWGESFNNALTGAGIVIDDEVIANFIQYFPVIYTELQQKMEKGQLNNISLTAMLDLASCFSSESNKYSYLFGAEDFKLIASNPGPNASSMVKEKRISKAIKDLKKIRDRDYVTVPPMDKDFDLKSGKKLNVVVGNFSNPINLTYGERTGACMRIGGAGESLYDFCLDNDNGFHIRFCNPVTGGFVSRVSGFRN